MITTQENSTLINGRTVFAQTVSKDGETVSGNIGLTHKGTRRYAHVFFRNGSPVATFAEGSDQYVMLFAFAYAFDVKAFLLRLCEQDDYERTP